MATPRYKLVDQTVGMFYHLNSRCVRKSWLCGYDQATRRNFSHRKAWFIERIELLATAFAIDVHAYAIMSNHFHLVVYYDPTACWQWTDEQAVERWLIAFPPKLKDGSIDEPTKAILQQILLDDPQQLRHIRETLGSMSKFMKHLKQPISLRANTEDGCQGHFFEKRFYSGAILTEAGAIAAMAYVDLNPIRAKIAHSLKQIKNASISKRLKSLANSAQRLKESLKPLISGLEGKGVALPITVEDYLLRLDQLINAPRKAKLSDETQRWVRQVAALKKKQRVFGPIDLITQWTQARGMQLREKPLP